MATAEISQRGRRKTMLIYRQDGGIALTQVDTRSDQKREIPLTAEDLDQLMSTWPEFRQRLLNADVPNVAPETPSPSASKASPGPSN